jgi:hypothetical protein
MSLTTVRQLMAAAALSVFVLSASALPSLEAVKTEVQKGNYAQAQTMMEEVVAAKPSSARAHYIYAEILAHNKRFDEAARQATTAGTLDPAIGFTEPAKFKAFEALLEREQREAKSPAHAAVAAPAMVARPAPAPEPSSGIPSWVWIAGLLAFGALAWSKLRRQTPAAPMGMPMAMSGAPAGFPAAGGGYGNNYGNGYGPGAMPQQGSGMMGVGLAAVGGVAAGMLAEKLMSGGSHESMAAAPAAVNQNGLVPGMFDDAGAQSSAAYELQQEPVDFGSGDDWGGDISGGGSDDW